ncbi:hypothetical protein AMATHDRAFT_58315 [Amanita thiersii Skay4041]|uniref:Uncharacterized protein n=1 Tax=Amanita thiersii Skay4041 TaxID=703135 RepID=A0A2A9NVK4_9AGAR|nr:hypothetical protein AMATHDRAFT_58315 [Amanita thiersii Skay4041]
MVVVTRPAPRFSLSMIEAEPIHVTSYTTSRRTCLKTVERQLVMAWKTVTQATRKSKRTSYVPRDFVLVTSRRRSILPPPPAEHQKRHRHVYSA